MYYISLKRQAKIISPNSSASSTDLTNNQKKLVSNRPGFPSNYFWLLKIITQWTRGSSRKSLFFYYKKQQATSKLQAASLSLYFFYLKKQQATSLSSTLDTCSRIL